MCKKISEIPISQLILEVCLFFVIFLLGHEHSQHPIGLTSVFWIKEVDFTKSTDPAIFHERGQPLSVAALRGTVVRDQFLSIKDVSDLEYRVLYFSIMKKTHIEIETNILAKSASYIYVTIQ